MNKIQFSSLEDVFECYGRGNLVAIDNLSQIIFYTSHGCQPKFVIENEIKPGRITCWFLKSESSYIYQQWQDQNSRAKRNG